jgi:predicted DNA-binding antitoxin AbrB/MazE fold protein
MTITVEATFENGVLRPHTPLPFADQDKVTLTIEAAAKSVDGSYGLIGWKGDSQTIQRIALDPEFDILESP